MKYRNYLITLLFLLIFSLSKSQSKFSVGIYSIPFVPFEIINNNLKIPNNEIEYSYGFIINYNLNNRISLRNSLLFYIYNTDYNLPEYRYYFLEFAIPCDVEFNIYNHKRFNVYTALGEYFNYSYKGQEISIENGNKYVSSINWDYENIDYYTKVAFGIEYNINKRFFFNIEPSYYVSESPGFIDSFGIGLSINYQF